MGKTCLFAIAVGMGLLGPGTLSGCTAAPAEPGEGNNGGSGGSANSRPEAGPIPGAGGAGATGGSGGSSVQDAGQQQSEASQPVCKNAGSTEKCTSCCSQQHAQGTEIFLKALAQCACEPGICAGGTSSSSAAVVAEGGTGEAGPVARADAASPGDAGGTATEGGGQGEGGTVTPGPCSGECSSNMTAVSGSCNDCIRGSLGTPDDTGPCEKPVSTACDGSDDCKDLFDCLGTCPQ
jgi:hypothetical protein